MAVVHLSVDRFISDIYPDRVVFSIKAPIHSPLYSVEVMEEAMEPFSQSRSMFLLDALLSIGYDSIEHTEAALEDTIISQSDNESKRIHKLHLLISAFPIWKSHLFDSAPPEMTLSASVAKERVDPR